MFFSIIIPAYNAEKYIRESIESVLKQTFKDFELIIVNDGSTDKTLSICNEYAEQDKRVIVIDKKNGGASSAKNAGLNIAKGEYLVFIDSDDYWKGKSVLENINKRLNESDADVIYTTPIRHLEGTDKFVPQVLKCSREQIVNKPKKEVLETLLHSDGLHTGMPRYIPKRDLIENNNFRFVEGEVAEDLYWCARIIVAANTFDLYETPFYVYRKRINSVSGSKNAKLVTDYGKNIARCNSLAETIKEADFYKCLKAYISYQYSIMFYLVSKQGDKKPYIGVLKENKDVLKYAVNKKAKLIRILTKILGINGALYVLSILKR